MPRRNENAVKGVHARKFRPKGHGKNKKRSIDDAPMTNFNGHVRRRIR